MNYLKSYKLFEATILGPNSFNLRYLISRKLHQLNILRFDINSDLTVDVYADIDIRNKNLYELPCNFGKVDGNFYVSDNQLKDFKGFPNEVGRMLCGGNEFENLNGCTNIIRGDFNCSDCKLTSLEGGPQIIDGYYSFTGNLITNFKGFPKDFKNSIFYDRNPISEVMDIFLKTFNGYITRQGGGDIGQLIDLINKHDVIDGDNINWLSVEEIFYEYIPGIAIDPLNLNNYLKMWLRDEIPNPDDLKLKNYKIII
jgi:hypothetical protein